MALPWSKFCSADGLRHSNRLVRCPTCHAINPLPQPSSQIERPRQARTEIDLTVSPELQPSQSALFIPSTSSSSSSSRTPLFGENIRQNALLRKKAQGPVKLKAIIYFYLYLVQNRESEDNNLSLLEQVQICLDNSILGTLHDFLHQELLPNIDDGKYVRDINDEFRLSTGIVRKRPVFISSKVQGFMRTHEFLKDWFSHTNGSYQIYVIIQRRTVADEMNRTDMKIKREVSKSPDIKERQAVIEDDLEESVVQEDLDEEECLDASLKHALSLSPSPPHRTRRKYVLQEDDKNRAAEYGPLPFRI
ncbi:uncharacterized protein BO80DRAFT_421326 [Aspergillus ibericus CBS 121593]|uniref:Uncharacterized protein n=1 Tax=Aspergillus ibericus CBS 121593 TaxID=1448316 RepID=A0A395HE56_9EURO|nr:hypothetical protein BO80DRAFT_421326 [Aspergillus ibericus CBS 121593]RAL05268.1 hypothetical protein BO80DRAFT_421326 [Aspergillus ibericus CBS 121593]